MYGQTKVKTLVQQALQKELLMTFHTEVAFETVSQLAEGGMGKVYRVRDRRLDREAALKVLRPGRTDEDSTVRFLREARITAQLSHPAIPPVYEAGITPEGCPYLLMKLIQGRTLSDLITEFHSGPVTAAGMRPLLVALLRAAEAVAYAHSQGVIHRDLKPDNIMIGNFGEVLVLDWGLAKEKSSKDEELFHKDPSDSHHLRPGLTVKGNILGTASYMAPEQARGEDIDERVDIFALGAILCEIMTGHPPIEGDSAFVLLVRASEGLISTPEDYNPKVDPALAAISAAALSADRDARPEDLGSVIHWLQCYLDNKPVPICHDSFQQFARRKIQQHPSFIVGLLSVFFLTLISILFVELLSTRELVEILGSQTAQARDSSNQSSLSFEERARLNAQKVDALAKLRALAKQKQFGHVFRCKVERALDLDPEDHHFRLQIAQLCRQGQLHKLARPILLDIASQQAPAYEALFALYQIDRDLQRGRLDGKPHRWLEEISRRSKKSDERNEFIFFAEASNAQERKDWKQALTLYDAAERYNRTLPTLYIRRGIVKTSLKDALGAIQDLNRALKQKPNDYRALFHRANALKDLSQWTPALRDYSRCIAINPNFDKAYTNRGAIYSRLGMPEKALTDFNRAIQLHSKTVLGYSNRGNYYANKKQWKKALADYNQALANDPLFALGYLKRGATRDKLGEAGAARDFKRFLELDPKSPLAGEAQNYLIDNQLRER